MDADQAFDVIIECTVIVLMLFILATVIFSICGIVKEIRKERRKAKAIPMEKEDQGDETNDQSSFI